VEQAKSNVANTAALIPILEAGRRDAQIRLCVLLGIPPRELTELAVPGLAMPSISPDQPDQLMEGLRENPDIRPFASIIPAPADPQYVVALGIPADLLRRRPDVLEAERLVAAQSARIGVAAADWFPSVTIAGSIQLEAENFSDLFRQSSTAGFLSPGFRWNVLNYNRILNNVRVQDARFQQLVLNYQQTVLSANAEVEAALIAYLKAQQRVWVLGQAVQASEKSVELAQIQYAEGAVDFNRVALLQSDLASQQDALAVTEGELALNLIAVYKALGGGWEIRLGGQFGPPPLPEIEPVEQIEMPPVPEPEAATMEAQPPQVIFVEE
jgi:outer membrane protein TolC